MTIIISSILILQDNDKERIINIVYIEKPVTASLNNQIYLVISDFSN